MSRYVLDHAPCDVLLVKREPQFRAEVHSDKTETVKLEEEERERRLHDPLEAMHADSQRHQSKLVLLTYYMPFHTF